MRSLRFLLFLLLSLICAFPAVAQETPNWIWGEQDPDTGELEFTRRFELPDKPESAVIHVSADDFFVLTVNGNFLLFSENWRNLRKIDIAGLLREGGNSVTIRARNRDGAAGMIAWIEAEFPGDEPFRLVTDASWRTRPGESDESKPWSAAEIVGPLGTEPWGDPWSGSGVEDIRAPEGFTIEKVHDVDPAHGSWVALCTDGRGGFYASDQNDRGLYHFRIEDGAVADLEKVPVDVTGAQGLATLDGVLYAHVSGRGLLRITDTDADGLVDEVETLPGSRGRGEHGIHAVVAEPGRGTLLVVGGNGSKLPEVTASRVPVSYENHLLERFHDPLHLKRKAWVAPAGWICRFDPETEEYETISVGYRNAYDVAVNAFGDLFTFDSDEEWDLGLPWYRPTRVCIATSGSDYGWRAGSDNWPAYYEDSLPALRQIGPGSPTGMLSGAGSNFPPRYQDAIYALDWTYGTMRALHLTPSGSTYDVEVEEFVVGTPLPMTDAVIAGDGSMVFITGGRRIASSVYRVSYDGPESTEPADPADSADSADGEGAREARELRRELAKFHGHRDSAAVEAAWPHLASEDRFLRHAARVAIEWQPVESWLPRLREENRPRAIVTGVIALARMEEPDHAALAQERLARLNFAELDESTLLGALRAQSLVWERLGVRDPDAAVENLLAHFPHESGLVTRETARLLAFRDEPRMIEPALRVLEESERPGLPAWASADVLSRNPGDSYGGTFARYLKNQPPETAIRVASFLVELSPHWTEEQARRYFEFLQGLRRYQGGASYGRFQVEFRERALAGADAKIAAIAADFPPIQAERRPIQVTPPEGPGRTWTVEGALQALEETGWEGATRRSGRNLFHATTCVVCHQFDGEGGAIGPDLSNARGKFGPREMLEAIIEPSKAISDQFGSYDVELKSGDVLNGLVIEGSSGETVSIYVGEELKQLPREEVVEIRQSPISTMPPGLVNALNPGELRDLVAHLLGRVEE